MRNIPKKGIGFFDANNFYPDFILWLETDNTQYINFIDPKGIHNLGLNNDKIQFCRNIDDLNVCTIKNIEHKLESTNKGKNIILNAFILSDTKKKDIDWWDENRVANDKYNITFMYDDNDNDSALSDNINCINDLFNKIIEK